MIELKHVDLKYHDHIIFDDANIIIPNQKLVGITGKSGSGKTSLLYMLGLISTNQKYEYYINNQRIDIKKQKSELKKHSFAYIFQDNALPEYLTVEENIQLYGQLSHQTIDEERIQNLLRIVHLQALNEQRTDTLSGGQRQRLALACALAKNPEVIIADEITASLDLDNAKNIINILKELVKLGKTVILSSHDARIIEQCDVVYQINNHKIEALNNFTIGYQDISIKHSFNHKVNPYRWFSKFDFGASKIEKTLVVLIPVIVSMILLCLTGLKNTTINNYTSKINSGSYDVKVECNDASVDFIGKFSNYKGIENIYPIHDLYTTEIEVNEKSYSNYAIEITSIFTKESKVAITAFMAKKYNIEIGDIITINIEGLKNNNFTVEDIIDDKLFYANGNMGIYLPGEYYEDDLNSSTYLIEFNDVDQINTVIQKIYSEYPNSLCVVSDSEYQYQLNKLKELQNNMNKIISSSIIIEIVILSIIQGIGVNTHKKELSILLANGLSLKDIVFLNSYIQLRQIIKSILLLVIGGLIMNNMIIITVQNVLLIIIILLVVYTIPSVSRSILILYYQPEKILKEM